HDALPISGCRSTIQIPTNRLRDNRKPYNSDRSTVGCPPHTIPPPPSEWDPPRKMPTEGIQPIKSTTHYSCFLFLKCSLIRCFKFFTVLYNYFSKAKSIKKA